MLRDYQQRSIDQLYAWFAAGNEGNPCLSLPTGSGKSHIVAALCKDVLQSWPDQRILMLTHVQELLSQNSEKMRQHWPGAPMGIYSSALRLRQLGEPITFAGIQSIRKKADQVGHIDLVIIDECHLVSHKDEGGYRRFLSDLKKINPSMRVVGLTATPYRLGHGMITEGSALFHAIIEPVTIEELIHKGHLSTLRSKFTKTSFDTSGVHKRGGEFIESELQAAVDTATNNLSVVEEVIEWAGDRKAWLFFCTGVDHAQNVADTLNYYGIKAECVIGTTPKAQRERILADFKAGKIRALTNANVLTTGFDYPDIDLIAMLRPTMSASLYVQMAGRGMRIKSHTDHCLVLDFARVVQTHGPITRINPGKPKGEGLGEAPVKTCENCKELVPISVKVCPNCEAPFPIKEPPRLRLHQDDIMGERGKDMELTSWQWRKHISKNSGNVMLAVTYYGALSDPSVTEYLVIHDQGYAGEKARMNLTKISSRAGVTFAGATSLEEWADRLNLGAYPNKIEYTKERNFYKVMKRSWDHGESA